MSSDKIPKPVGRLGLNYLFEIVHTRESISKSEAFGIEDGREQTGLAVFLVSAKTLSGPSS